MRGRIAAARDTLVGGLLLLAGLPASADEQGSSPRAGVGGSGSCLSYGDRLTLSGRLVRRTYPGRPNYESVARGDEPETVLILVLPKPICMAESATHRNGIDVAFPRITEVQLGATSRQLGVRPGRTLRISGAAFGAHTGHHHTSIVLADVAVEDVR